MKRAKIIIKGEVQKVGFRGFVREHDTLKVERIRE